MVIPPVNKTTKGGIQNIVHSVKGRGVDEKDKKGTWGNGM